MLSIWLLSLTMLPQPTKVPMFVGEHASRGQFRFSDGILDIHRGTGWLRTPRLYSDFRLSLEFRPLTADAEVSVTLRALTSDVRIFEPAYRITLPLFAESPGDALRGPKDAIELLKQGRVQSTAANDGWQRLEVIAVLGEITIVLNSELVAVYRVKTFAGYILVTSHKGHLQMRNVMTTDLEPSFDTPPGTVTTEQLKSGEGTLSKLRDEIQPFYTIETLHVRKIAGVVALEAIVLPNGDVGSVRVTRSVDPDLDKSAVATVRRWKFSPASVNGAAVPVRIEVEMTFKITK